MELHQSGFRCPLTSQMIAGFVLQSFTVIHILVIVFGLYILLAILKSMVRVALMNRHDMDIFAALTSRAIHKLIGLRVRSARNFEESQQIVNWFFGSYMLTLIAVYFVGVLIAFAFLYWGAWAVTGWNQAFLAAGSGLNTLGFATPPTRAGQWLAIPEGALGLGLVVFLFTFIPGYQSAISSRDTQTAWLYARLATLTHHVDLLGWFERVGNTQDDDALWEMWESWFRLLADSHSSSPMLSVVPSVQKGQSWIVAAAIVLDAAAFSVSTIATAHSEPAKVCLHTGSRAISLIAESLRNSTNKQMKTNQNVSRKVYDDLCDQLAKKGISLKADREASWREFVGFRSRYASSISYLAERAFVPLVDTLGDSRSC